MTILPILNTYFVQERLLALSEKLGFNEPAYAGFAGPSLFMNIPISKVENYKDFSHCMEVHNEGIVLAWQARCMEDKIFIGVAGTKAFYGDCLPGKDESFAKNRNLVQLNIDKYMFSLNLSQLPAATIQRARY